ncbi:MAG: hypothetical protein R6V54_08760 [Desulfobacteraceae bacterium]
MINRIDQPARIFPEAAANKNSTNGARFQRTLDKMLETKASDNTQQTDRLSELSLVQPTLKDPARGLEEKTDRLLNLLDAYSATLKNPENSLKTIEPALKEIKTTAGKLLKETKAENEESELKTIAMELALTANTEYAKFQRGDYG